MTNKELLAYWIMERDAIHRRRFAQGYSKPWSDDPVFQTVYFCNVRREDDKVTKWIREYYTPEFFGNNYELAICAARLFNHPPTLEYISNYLVNFNPDELLQRIQNMQNEGHQVWGGAYLITTHGQKMPKADYCVGVLKDAYDVLPRERSLCLEAFADIQMIDGFGSFLAAQVVADLKNTIGHPLKDAEDWKTFSAPGPGSMRGVNWFHGGRPNTKCTPMFYQEAIITIRRWLELQSDAAYIVKDLCDQDLQNCLCEYDKYMRVKTGTGRSKRNYKGVE